MQSPLWSESGASRYPWEREALEYLRAGLPDHEPFRAWPNVEFIADDGSVNEVDLLVVVPNGVFLIEIKSYPNGILTGDSQLWRWKRPNGHVSSFDHPLIATDRKAKRLKSLLARQKALRNERRVPFIEALVFLSGADLSIRLEGTAVAGVVGRDEARHKPPGVLTTLKDSTLASIRSTTINRPMSKALADAVLQAGIRPRTSHLRLGDWTLGKLIDEGPGWQDFEANRTSPKADRRVRIYLAGRATSKDDAALLKATAEQEFRLLERLRHPNISQVFDLQQHEYGPALLIDRVETEQRLDHWAADNLAALDLFERLALIRQLGEAISYAHRQGISHRMLTPRHVLVRRAETKPGASASMLPQLVIGHWNLGTADASTELAEAKRLTQLPTKFGVSQGIEMADRLEEQDRVYLAPELGRSEQVGDVLIDVFSLGAIAALLLGDQPPAADLEARETAFARNSGFVVSGNFPARISDSIAFATDPVPANRFESVDDFLRDLDSGLDDATSPSTEVDPLDANPGDVIDGGWTFKQRLGGGSTAVAFLCERGPVIEVLKVARSEDHAQRLREEAETLERLWALKPLPIGIIEYRGIDRIAGHTTLHLAPAGSADRSDDMTLGNRLRRRGRPGLDMLARWGDDLMETLVILERAGIAHRDIKPDNLGVTQRGKNREPHLVLFDFSLAKTALTDLGAGTPGYLDPFLTERPTRRWDTAADRYSAAATLFEMATGRRPIWGDGNVDPKHLESELPEVGTSLFDPSVADGLTAFFRQALQRDPERRYGTAEEMRSAWGLALSTTNTPTLVPPSPSSWDEALPIQQLGLSPAAIDLLEGTGVHTVGQLVDVTSPDVSRIRTVSNVIRQEILVAAALQRRHRAASIDDVAVDARSVNARPDNARSVDAIVARLLPSDNGSLKDHREPLARLLGLSPPLQRTGADFVEPTAWLGAADSAQLGLSNPHDVRTLLMDSRRRWSKNLPMKELRNELMAKLNVSDGLASGDELARWLVARRGTTATGYTRLQRGRAVVRAALETASPEDGLCWRRLVNGRVVVSLTTAVDGDDMPLQLADYASELGRSADEISKADPLLSPQRALTLLRAVPRPTPTNELSDARVLRLAADSSASAALSSRNELYPHAMSAERALLLARSALLVPGLLSEDQIRERVAARFPDAEELPPMAALATLLADVGLGWTEGPPGGFRVAVATNMSESTAIAAHSTRYRTSVDSDNAAQDSERIQAKLDRSIGEGGYLVCSVEPSRFLLAERALERLEAVRVDVDETLLDALHDIAREKNITWEAILAADEAGPSGPRWGNLARVANLACQRLESAVLAAGPLVVLTRCGLLERFGELGVLDRLREATTRVPHPGQRIRTLWVLVPSTDLTAAPTIHDRVVATTPGGSERLALESVWFDWVSKNTNLEMTTL